jgi:hypothetical protein
MSFIAVVLSIIGFFLFLLGTFRSWKAHFWLGVVFGPIVSIVISVVSFLGEEVGVIILSGITLWCGYLLYLTGKEKRKTKEIIPLRLRLMATFLIAWLLSILFWMVDGTGHYLLVALF